MMLHLGSRAPQAVVLLLEGCHLLPQEGILLSQGGHHQSQVCHFPAQLGVLPLQPDDHLGLAGEAGPQPCDLLLQFLPAGSFLSQQGAQRRSTQGLETEVVVRGGTAILHHHDRPVNDPSHILNSYTVVL